MGRLCDEEVRHLPGPLYQYVEDAGRLAEIEDELRGESAAECLGRTVLLGYFTRFYNLWLAPKIQSFNRWGPIGSLNDSSCISENGLSHD
jgi:hypothetical protein